MDLCLCKVHVVVSPPYSLLKKYCLLDVDARGQQGIDSRLGEMREVEEGESRNLVSS